MQVSTDVELLVQISSGNQMDKCSALGRNVINGNGCDSLEGLNYITQAEAWGSAILCMFSLQARLKFDREHDKNF